MLTEFTPDIHVLNFKLRKVNFSAFFSSTIHTARSDASPAIRKKAEIKQNESCPDGIICIEDFGQNDKNYRKLIKAVNEIRENNSKCRIAFFGDSFTEGDMIIAHLRDTLQQVYGGNGVGFVPFTSPVSRLRPTIEHKYKGWTTYSIMERSPSPFQYGISGCVFVPKPDAYVTFKVPRFLKWNTLKGYAQIRLFYHANQDGFALIQTDNRTPERISLKSGVGIQQVELNTSDFQSITIQHKDLPPVVYYGASLEGKAGIYIDNFSLRGNSGTGLLKISSNMLSATDSFQHYGLIIIEYGLNVSGGNTAGLALYEKEMEKTIEHLQVSFPEAGILIMGISDRGRKTGNGEIQSMPQVKTIREQQRKLAVKYGLLYWDTFEAMGGNNSITQLVEKGWAEKDYTHLTFAGGRKIAGMISKALIFEIENRKKTEIALMYH